MSESMSLARVRSAAGLSVEQWPDEMILAVKGYAAREAKTVAELAVFLATAARYDLNPMVGEVFLIPSDSGPKVFAGRDAWIKVANRSSLFRGIEYGVVYEKDEFRVVRESQKVRVEHVMSFDRGKIVGAYCVVYVEGRPPVLEMRRWDNYAALHTKKNWRSDGDGMLTNRVIAAALRRTFPLSGLLIEGEDEVVSELPAPTGPTMTVAAVAVAAEAASGTTSAPTAGSTSSLATRVLSAATQKAQPVAVKSNDDLVPARDVSDSTGEPQPAKPAEEFDTDAWLQRVTSAKSKTTADEQVEPEQAGDGEAQGDLPW